MSLLALLCWLFWPTMTNNNKGNVIVFEVGPSVKFVSAIKDAIFNNKKWGSIFFLKKCQTGGVRGGFGKRPDFFRFLFCAPFPNHLNYNSYMKMRKKRVLFCSKKRARLIQGDECPCVISRLIWCIINIVRKVQDLQGGFFLDVFLHFYFPEYCILSL